LSDLAKRVNKTLVERVRCILFEIKLTKHFLGEALLAIIHVINLSSMVALNTKVFDKIWFGKNVSYYNLYVYGCKLFVYTLKDEKFKMIRKTRQFIGYYQDKFSYKLYDSIEKKLVKSHDVQFIED